jgi:hypothetical protein
MTSITVVPPEPTYRPIIPTPAGPAHSSRPEVPTLHVVRWQDPVADPHGVHPCSRYVELYWLGIIGPSTCLLRPVVKHGTNSDDPCRRHDASRHILTNQS